MIPMNDLKRIEPDLLSEIKEAVTQCMEKGWYLLGPETTAFEKEFADYCEVKHCMGVANGTDALEIAIRALGINAGEEVATVANAGMYSTIAIRNVGAKPLYIDIDAINMTMDPTDLEKRITKNTKAIIVTHLYGQLAPLMDIMSVANHYQIPVVEDCAQAHGATLLGKKAGSIGTIGCFSFYPTKNLGALGDAGAITAKEVALAERIIKLRQYGWEKKYNSVLKGGKNSRLDEMQATILRIKLKRLDTWNERRRQIAFAYREGLKKFPIVTPQNHDASYVAHLYVIRSKQREALKTYLADANIQTDIHYPIPDYLQPSIKNDSVNALTTTETSCNEVLTLPCFPHLKSEEVNLIIERIQTFFKN